MDTGFDSGDLPGGKEAGISPSETVRIGQTFRLFPHHRTAMTTPLRDAKEYEGIPEFESGVVLDTNGLLPDLPIELSAEAIYKNQVQAFTPFSPEDGYQVTTEDFDGEKRVKKRYKDSEDFKDIKSSPLVLFVHADRLNTQLLGLLDDNDRFTHEALETLIRLRLQLFFPNGLRFEARPELNRYNSGNIDFFGGYYPVDAKPLAVPGYMRFNLDHGLQIALPAKGEKLQQIDGQFLLAPHPVGMRTLPGSNI